MGWQETYLFRFYRSLPGWLDGTTEFHSFCLKRIAAGARILEIGAGPANATSQFLASIGELHGVDIDPDISTNPDLVSAVAVRGTTLPYKDSMFDACVSNYVLEHVEHPAIHLEEVARVLKPGGCYLFRTPNKYHYVSLVARLTPHWFHKRVANRLRNMRSEAHDPYPTYYRLNSRGDVLDCASSVGLRVDELRFIEKEPCYGLIARPLFLLMCGYERIVNSSRLLEGIRANILASLSRA